ncbi:MAG: type IV pilin protein [Bacteroidota bacterium]
MNNLRSQGFTLIELMITVVIIGIIAMIAYPSYTKYMAQTRRSDAQIALTRIASQQEKYFSDCNHYAAKLYGASQDCGTAADYSDGKLGLNKSDSNTTILSDNRDYVITLVTPTSSSGTCFLGSCFTLQATPATTSNADVGGNKGTGRQVGNGKLRITSTGVKSWDKANTNSPSDSTQGPYAAKWTDK